MKTTSFHRLTDGIGTDFEHIHRTTRDDFAGNDQPKLKFLSTIQFAFRANFSNAHHEHIFVPPDITATDSLNNNTTVVEDFGGIEEDPRLLGSTIDNYTIDDGANGVNTRTGTKDDYDRVVKENQQRRQQINSVNSRGSGDMSTMGFALKQVTRPSPLITYQDVNYYNFRTKVATKMDYGAMNVTFYDDNKNSAHNVFETYMSSISPIFGISRNVENFDALEAGTLDYERTVSSVFAGQNAASSIGPLQHRMGVINHITVSHYYAYTTTNNEYIVERMIYRYVNPKVTNFVLDELDMTQSDASTITMTMNYDTVNVFREIVDSKDLTSDTVASEQRQQSSTPRDIDNLVAQSGSNNLGIEASTLSEPEEQGNFILNNVKPIMEQAGEILNTVSLMNSGVSLDSLSQFGVNTVLQGFGTLTSQENIGALIQNVLGFGGSNTGQLFRNIATNSIYSALAGFIREQASLIQSGNFIIDSFISAGTERVTDAAYRMIRDKVGG